MPGMIVAMGVIVGVGGAVVGVVARLGRAGRFRFPPGPPRSALADRVADSAGRELDEPSHAAAGSR